MKLTAIIIDDNRASIQLLEKLLSDFFKEINVIESFTSVKSSIETIANKNPDIVFLDVEMPGENGFALFDYIPQPHFETIFITAYKEYAADAFRVSSIDYLIKPIDPEELKGSIARVKAKASSNAKLQAHKSKLAIQTKTGIEFIEIAETRYCQANDNYTFIHLLDKKKLVSKPLKNFQLLLEPQGFFRTSRSYLINLKYIKCIKNGRKSEVVLEDDTLIPLSQENKKILIDLLSDKVVINL